MSNTNEKLLAFATKIQSLKDEKEKQFAFAVDKRIKTAADSENLNELSESAHAFTLFLTMFEACFFTELGAAKESLSYPSNMQANG